MINLVPTNKGDPQIKKWMGEHYSKPKGFVGRQLIYLIEFSGKIYGAIAGGSGTRFLPGRKDFFGYEPHLQCVVNNTFFHVERPEEGYPLRNFTSAVVRIWRNKIVYDWPARYNSPVLAFETLVELPRTGELYKRDGWTEVGKTKGFTCKRVGGESTDSWSGKRVWYTENLRPKLVFVRHAF